MVRHMQRQDQTVRAFFLNHSSVHVAILYTRAETSSPPIFSRNKTANVCTHPDGSVKAAAVQGAPQHLHAHDAAVVASHALIRRLCGGAASRGGQAQRLGQRRVDASTLAIIRRVCVYAPHWIVIFRDTCVPQQGQQFLFLGSFWAYGACQAAFGIPPIQMVL